MKKVKGLMIVFILLVLFICIFRTTAYAVPMSFEFEFLPRKGLCIEQGGTYRQDLGRLGHGTERFYRASYTIYYEAYERYISGYEKNEDGTNGDPIWDRRPVIKHFDASCGKGMDLPEIPVINNFRLVSSGQIGVRIWKHNWKHSRIYIST